LFSEREATERVHHAVDVLRATGKKVTRKNILECMDIRYKSSLNAAYFQSPHAQKLLKQIDDEVQAEQKRQQERDSDDMLIKVQQAIQQLQDCKEPVTLQAVGNIIEISSRKFIYYPKVQAIIKQHASYQHYKTKQSRLLEDEITEKVQRAIQLLEERQQPVTEKRVCRMAGISTSCLSTYPCLRTLLNHYIDHQNPVQLALTTQRENELLIQVENAILKLHSLNQRVTKTAIAAIVGLSQGNLQRYPLVKVLLDKNAGVYYHNTRAYSQERENELLVQVKAAKEYLEFSEQKVTQGAVAKMVGMSIHGLTHYPKIRVLLLQEKNKNRSRSTQKEFSEEELLIEMEKAILQLEEQEILITVPKVSAIIGISSIALYRHAQCIFIVEKAAKDQKRRRYERKDEQMLQNVREAIKQLKASDLLITVSAVAKVLHVSVNNW